MRILARRRYFCGTRKGSFEQIVNIFRLFLKSNTLCRYNDNELVPSRPQERQLSKLFCLRTKCVLK